MMHPLFTQYNWTPWGGRLTRPIPLRPAEGVAKRSDGRGRCEPNEYPHETALLCFLPAALADRARLLCVSAPPPAAGAATPSAGRRGIGRAGETPTPLLIAPLLIVPLVFIVLGIVLALASPTVRAQAYLDDNPAQWSKEVAVEYTVSLHRAKSQMVDISMRVPNSDGVPIELHLPTWRPGKYVVLDPAGTIVSIEAFHADGQPLRIHKTAKSSWRVETFEPGDIVVEYSLYANSLNDRTRHADDTHAFLSGSSVFLYTDELRDRPLRVWVDAPERWQVATGLASDPAEEWAWLSPDYDVLVDSPLEIGEHELIGFSVEGVPHDIVIWGPVEADAERLAADFAAIVRVQRDIFEGPGGQLPYQRYVFLIHAQPGLRGGTEHLNSTIMQTGPSTFTSESSYAGFLGLVSHEMFHTWNVKRLRPAGLSPYDYQLENYTDLLWVAEGTTSYYDDVTLVRAGLLDADKYLAQIAKTIARERRRPGSAVQSLADSSYDAWIKFNRATPNDINTTVSFYSKGALVSLMLDMELRTRTDNRASLDLVLRDLYRRHPLASGGFTTADMLAALEARAGSSFEGFFAAFVSGTEPLDLERAFAVAGVELLPEEMPAGSYLGLSLRDTTVRTIRSDGPAFEAGVQVDDILETIDGETLAGSLEEFLEEIKPGTRLTLGLERRGEHREIEIVTIAPPIKRWRLERLAEPSNEQRAVYESWLGQGWPEAAGAAAGEPVVPSDP
ncbi:Putative protease [hydrothermal vent metagenome]|uniref:Protease n=1 Tax=hydrothermal vent metagenome TaxID=652676 RepID=A0A3B1E2F0_9ZZZZ